MFLARVLDCNSGYFTFSLLYILGLPQEMLVLCCSSLGGGGLGSSLFNHHTTCSSFCIGVDVRLVGSWMRMYGCICSVGPSG